MIGHAIVMGGSVAGLCAAAALAAVARSVTLLERDPDPRGALPRKGTPQAHHAHVLLNLGARSLSSLFPGILDELRTRGAVCADAAASFRWFLHGGWRPHIKDKGLELRMQTRPLLEACLRERVQALPNVTVRFETAIEEPIYDAAAGRVRGVRLEDGTVLDADLVVDATGRGSRSPRWLEEWGFARPAQQTVEVGLAYVSGLFRVPAAAMPCEALMVNTLPPHVKRGGLVIHVEGDRYMSTLFGYHGEHAPTDLPGFRAWARGLARPEVADVLDQAEPITELHKITYPRQVRHLYEALPRLPGAYVIHGDAVCSFDPVYGQGMSVSAAQGVALREILARPGADTRAVQAAYGRIIDCPWQLTTTDAHLWRETRGFKPAGVRFMQAFSARMHAAAARDLDVFSAFLDVVHLDKPPSALFRPGLLWKILRSA